MGLDLYYDPGQTPLDDNEIDGLRIPSITTKGELDEFEQNNIEDALQWLAGKKFTAQQVCNENFVCRLHKEMFGQVWRWAGKYRRTEKNLGIKSFQVPIATRTLCDDVLYWVNSATYPPDEISIRFKHRIVSIHCFPNGNGRHSRLLADVIAEKIFHRPPFSWGAVNLSNPSSMRQSYITALRKADQGNYDDLISFARS